MGELLEYSLLEFDSHAQRYSQNDLIRFYIFRKLQQNPELLKTLKERYLNYYASFFEKLCSSQSSETDRISLIMKTEKNNLEAAATYFKSLDDANETKFKASEAVSKFAEKLSGVEKKRFLEIVRDILKYNEERKLVTNEKKPAEPSAKPSEIPKPTEPSVKPAEPSGKEETTSTATLAVPEPSRASLVTSQHNTFSLP